MPRSIVVAFFLFITGGAAADESVPCINLKVWDDEVQRTLSLDQPALTGGLAVAGYRPGDRVLEFHDESTGETLPVQLDDGFELSVVRETQEMNRAAQEAPWEVTKDEYEEAKRVIPFEQLAVDDQMLHAGNLSGCVARPEDSARFEADRLWVEDEALHAEGRMIRYERVFFGTGNVTGSNKGG